MPCLEPSTGSLPFQSDPDDRAGNTSRAGAEVISPEARSLRARYVRFLYQQGAHGATDLEASQALGIQRTTIIPRRTELGAHVVWSRVKRWHEVNGRNVPNKVWALAVFVDGAEPIDARRLA